MKYERFKFILTTHLSVFPVEFEAFPVDDIFFFVRFLDKFFLFFTDWMKIALRDVYV